MANKILDKQEVDVVVDRRSLSYDYHFITNRFPFVGKDFVGKLKHGISFISILFASIWRKLKFLKIRRVQGIVVKILRDSKIF